MLVCICGEVIGECWYSHSNAHDNISGIPETDITTIAAFGWWVPGHDEQVEVGEDVEDHDNVPGSELAARKIDF